jgi:phosphatidate phosphatase PAH1
MRFLIALLALCVLNGCALPPPAEIPTPPTPDAQAVVFDIDGTLTPTVYSVSVARTDAAKAVRAFADKSYTIVYLSTRISLRQAGIPSWLKQSGFPGGSIHVAQTDADHSNPDAFKTRVLKNFVQSGWKIVSAYGDSSTDFIAYAAVGIPKERVFALLREGDSSCQPGTWQQCLRGWTEHLETIAKTIPNSSTPPK